MNIQLHPYALVYLISVLAAAGLAWTAWRKRNALEAFSLFLNMLALSFWSGAYALMWASTILQAQVFWLNVSAIGAVLVPFTFLIFCLYVSRNGHFVTGKLKLLLSLEPLAGLILVWTNNYHRLAYSQPQLWRTNGLYELKWSPGPAIWADTAYAYFLIGVGLWFLVRALGQGGELHRRQVRTILIGACIPLLADLIYLSPLASYIKGFDLTPVAFTAAGMVYLFAITRQQLLEIIPIARGRVMENMSDGVIVIDLQERIVDINPAAEQFLGVTAAQVVGQKTLEVLKSWEEITRPFWDRSEIRTEIIVSQDVNRYIDLNITPLFDSRKRASGRLIVFRDVSTRRHSEIALREANQKLQEQLTEIRTLRDQLREQAMRDPLTDLFNRRYLEEFLAQELARAEREKYPICLMMIDIDRFKRVNDTCGHNIGDETLRSLARILQARTRRFDVACRYGGEEFIIVMPGLSLETAYERAETLRKEFASLPSMCEKLSVPPTLSIGVAAYPFHGADGEAVIHAADQAMYTAKSAGRNQTVVYSKLSESGVHSSV
jgi:diguanylate cyclase (GGDEF)-like protein/PAS domain S-box-containing protein